MVTTSNRTFPLVLTTRGSTDELVRKHGIAHSTFHRWKAKFGGMEVSEAKRLRELETENTRLKRRLADTMLEKHATEEALRQKW